MPLKPRAQQVDPTAPVLPVRAEPRTHSVSVGRGRTIQADPNVRRIESPARGGRTLPGALPGPSIGILEAIGGGAVSGLRKNFLTRPIIESIATAMPGVTTETLDLMEDRLADSNFATVASFVAEFGPDLALGFGAFGLGRAAAVRAVGAAGRAGVGGVGAQTTAKRLAGTVGERFATGKPGIERAAEAIGGSVGIGGLEGTRTLAEGGDLDEAQKAFLIAAGLTLGFEGALVGAGAAANSLGFIKKLRDVSQEKIADIFEQGGKRILTNELNASGSQLARNNSGITSLTGAQSQLESLASGELSSVGRKSIKSLLKRPGTTVADIESVLTRKNVKLSEFESAAQRRTAARAIQKTLDIEPAAAMYTRDVPFNPTGLRLAWEKLGLQLVKTPDALRGEMGPTNARLYQRLDMAETALVLNEKSTQAIIIDGMETMRVALGLSKKAVRTDRFAFTDVGSAWERGETELRNFMLEAGRSADDTARAVSTFKALDKALLDAYIPLAERGAAPILDAKGLERLGVRNYLPHMLDDLPEKKLKEQLEAILGEPATAEVWELYHREGLAAFGSADFQRVGKGALSEKVKAGLPFDPNPFSNAFRYLTGIERRKQYGDIFGLNGELKPLYMKAIAAEGGSTELANSVIDIAQGMTYHDQSLRQLARVVTGTQIARKLTLAVIPNMTQSINTVVFNGVKASTQGFFQAMRKEQDSVVMEALGMIESSVVATGRALGQGSVGPVAGAGGLARAANIADTFARWTLTGTGFNKVERWNRLMAGHSGLYVFRDTVSKAVAGELKGNRLDIARRHMDTLGSNLDDIVRNARASGDDYFASAAYKQAESRSAFNAARTTQFTPSDLRRPGWWSSPVGRIIFQFKSFALGQGRFMRDQIFAEAVRGNMKPISYFLSMYPIAGEVVGSVRGIAKGKFREDEGIDRVIQDYMNVGGMGLVSDTFTSARFGGLSDSLWGPTIGGDLITFAERMSRGDIDGFVSKLAREPAFVAGRNLIGGTFLTVQGIVDHIERSREPAGAGRGVQLPDQAASFQDVIQEQRRIEQPQR